jgi:hypothetical protein
MPSMTHFPWMAASQMNRNTFLRKLLTRGVPAAGLAAAGAYGYGKYQEGREEDAEREISDAEAQTKTWPIPWASSTSFQSGGRNLQRQFMRNPNAPVFNRGGKVLDTESGAPLLQSQFPDATAFDEDGEGVSRDLSNMSSRFGMLGYVPRTDRTQVFSPEEDSDDPSYPTEGEPVSDWTSLGGIPWKKDRVEEKTEYDYSPDAHATDWKGDRDGESRTLDAGGFDYSAPYNLGEVPERLKLKHLGGRDRTFWNGPTPSSEFPVSIGSDPMEGATGPMGPWRTDPRWSYKDSAPSVQDPRPQRLIALRAQIIGTR